MSLEFSRRSFLKYTAVAAVAVAGASIFSGCEQTDSYNLLCTGAGEMTILQVTAGMGYDSTAKKYVAPVVNTKSTEISFPLKITNGRTNPIYVNGTNFKAVIADSKGNVKSKLTSADGLKMEASLFDTNLKKGSSVSGNIVATVSGLAEGDTVVLTYCPDLQYNEYSLNWKLTVAKAEETSGSDDNKDTNTEDTSKS